MNQDIPPGIRPAGFEHEYAMFWIFAQPIGESAARGAAAHDHEIVIRVVQSSGSSGDGNLTVRTLLKFIAGTIGRVGVLSVPNSITISAEADESSDTTRSWR